VSLIHLDLFSGVGGFHLASKLAGIRFDHTYYSDIEPFANEVYAKNFPQSVPLGDIRTIDGHKLRQQHPDATWIVTGGFPCQDISQAGTRTGLAGSRSGLWFEMLRIIHGVRPRAIIAENVAALCRNGLDRVLISLAQIGYDAEWQIISAASVGAPHLRERMWIVAYPSIADTCLHRCEHHQSSQQTPQECVGNGQHSYAENEALPDWTNWTRVATEAAIHSEPALYRVDDGSTEELDRRLSRIKACGNAIVPQVAAGVFRALKASGILEAE
jgi:DNA (cytosine-5)-methyltransferase 1